MPGSNSFTATTTAGYLIGPGFFHEAVDFQVVAAISVLGSDGAVFFDGAGSNTFVGTPTQAYLYGSGYFEEAVGYKTVVASEVHGNSDTAQLYDTGGSNTFVGTPTYAYLISSTSSFFNEAAGFQSRGHRGQRQQRQCRAVRRRQQQQFRGHGDLCLSAGSEFPE